MVIVPLPIAVGVPERRRVPVLNLNPSRQAALHRIRRRWVTVGRRHCDASDCRVDGPTLVVAGAIRERWRDERGAGGVVNRPIVVPLTVRSADRDSARAGAGRCAGDYPSGSIERDTVWQRTLHGVGGRRIATRGRHGDRSNRRVDRPSLVVAGVVTETPARLGLPRS